MELGVTSPGPGGGREASRVSAWTTRARGRRVRRACACEGGGGQAITPLLPRGASRPRRARRVPDRSRRRAGARATTRPVVGDGRIREPLSLDLLRAVIRGTSTWLTMALRWLRCSASIIRTGGIWGLPRRPDGPPARAEVRRFHRRSAAHDLPPAPALQIGEPLDP